MIVTFYSYKGGTGRSMMLANIAGLLSTRGKKVLIVDFDLEAPGLPHYFASFRHGLERRPGLMDLLLKASGAADQTSVDWRDYVTDISFGPASISLMTAGVRTNDYASNVLRFDWTGFFGNANGGDFIERMRTEWKQQYDLVFIDSRTGITDIGGICTILLPDVIVAVFAANLQSIEGVVDVIGRAQARRKILAYDRPPIVILPVLSRFDSRTEFESGQEWLDIAARHVGEFYADWLPAVGFSPRHALERTKIPYVAYFSFGEKLPVLTHSIDDPDSVGYALDTIAQLIDGQMQNAGEILGVGRRIIGGRLREYDDVNPQHFSTARSAGRFLKRPSIWAPTLSLFIILLITYFAVLVPSPANPANPACARGGISIEGSTAFAPAASVIAARYMNMCSESTIALIGTDSGQAVSDLRTGASIAMSDGSAPNATASLFIHPVAIVIFSVVVNSSTSIHSLTLNQLRAIYSGRIRNWRSFGGPNQPIIVVARERTSGIRAILYRKILGPAVENGVRAVLRTNTSEVLTYVNDNPGAIGYAGTTVAASSRSFPNIVQLELNNVVPSPQTVRSGLYPFWAVEYFYTRVLPRPGSLLAAFLKYLTTDTSRAIMLDFGHIPCQDGQGGTLVLCAKASD